ncbi:nuclear pore complex protein Nup153-like isoform X2 [Leptidea sinapis]|uniref:nuclear pore complex protein Nup153-like isoform X2 n=1 Tax=Leptidea sinapis TaxID=189913 RepID=UPI0021201BB3|nr:nuclear pore complex protein Nup153-like isoform X2 [Leptidea sinapis]
MNSSSRDKQSCEIEDTSNNTFVMNVTSRMSGLLPASITKWFGYPRSSNTNGSTHVDPTDSSTEDEASDSQVINPPAAKRLCLSPSAKHKNVSKETKFITSHLDSPEVTQVSVYTQTRRSVLKKLAAGQKISSAQSKKADVKYTSTISQQKLLPLKYLSSGDSSVTRKRKSLYDSYGNNNDSPNRNEENSQSELLRSKKHSYYKHSLLRSSFYPERTTYGGFANCLKSANIQDKKTVLLNKSESSKDVNVSHSVRKIMDLLDNSSSPLIEAKRISGFLDHGLNNSKSDCSESNESDEPELHIPKMAPMLLMKQTKILMEKTSAARQLIASHSSSSRSFPYLVPISTTKNNGKITSKHLQKDKVVNINILEEPSIVNLPSAELHIDMDNLPTFSFENSTSSCVPSPIIPTSTSKDDTKETNLKVSFEEDSNCNKDLQFRFRSPERNIDNRRTDVTNDNESCDVASLDVTDYDESCDAASIDVTNNEESSDVASIDVTNNSESCDVVSIDVTNNSESCDVVSIDVSNINESCDVASTDVTNNNETCDVASKKLQEKIIAGLGDGIWKCNDCCVSNKFEPVKCVCCGSKSTPQIEFLKKCYDCNAILRNEAEQCLDCKRKSDSVSDLLVKSNPPEWKCNSINKELLKSPENVWKCKICLLENKIEDKKCVACFTQNSSSVAKTGDLFKNDGCQNFFGAEEPIKNMVQKQASKWECPSCLVQNSPDKSKCVCCESPKPGTDKKHIKSFNFDFTGAAQFKFGINTIMPLAEKEELSSENKLGITEKNNNTLPNTSFKFGIPLNKTFDNSESENKKDSEKPAFKFGIFPEYTLNTTATKKNNNQGTEIALQPTSNVVIGETPKEQEIPHFENTLQQQVPQITQTNSELVKQPSEEKPQTFKYLPQSLGSDLKPTVSVSNETLNIKTTQSSDLKSNDNIAENNLNTNSNIFVPSKSLPSAELSVKPNFDNAVSSTVSQHSIQQISTTAASIGIPSKSSLFSKNESQSNNNNLHTTTPLFQAQENIATNSLPIFPSMTVTSVTHSWFNNKEEPTPMTSATLAPTPTPVFNFSSNTPNTATEKPKFNFTFGSSNKVEGSSIFTNTFGGAHDNNTNKFNLNSGLMQNIMPASTLSSGNVLLGNNVLGGNGLPENSNDMNVISSPIDSGVATASGIFGTPVNNGTNLWPPNNQSSSMFSSGASTNITQKPAPFQFGGIMTYNSNNPFGTSGQINGSPNFGNNVSLNSRNSVGTFCSNVPLYSNNSTGAFGSSAQQQNMFGISNSNGNSSLFLSPLQQPSNSLMFGNPQPRTNQTTTGMFGQPNMGGTPFGVQTQAVSAFEPNPASIPTFNFGSQLPMNVVGLNQQQSQQPGVYNFGGSAAASQFTIGSSQPGQLSFGGGVPQFTIGCSQSNTPSTAIRRIRKAVRRTTTR